MFIWHQVIIDVELIFFFFFCNVVMNFFFLRNENEKEENVALKIKFNYRKCYMKYLSFV